VTRQVVRFQLHSTEPWNAKTFYIGQVPLRLLSIFFRIIHATLHLATLAQAFDVSTTSSQL
jgi:hypothetical protein